MCADRGLETMIRRSAIVLGLLLASAVASFAGGGQAAPQARGWTLPPEAEDTKSPLTVDATVLATGKALYGQKCQRCHGPGGVGDGPDADPDAREDMDLTNPKRADRNSDGVVFYKVWNGRSRPKMPAFKDELTKEQVWAVVAYAQSLRRR
jgi:mono/diheme cytochrome c family protein